LALIGKHVQRSITKILLMKIWKETYIY